MSSAFADHAVSAEAVGVDVDELDDDDDAPFVRLVRPAAECEPPQPGLRSVFDLPGASAEVLRRMAMSLKQNGRTGHDAAFRIERSGDITRRLRVQLEETEEWQEREAARRARQVVPRATGYKRQKSRKLRELIGDAARSAR